MKEERLSGGPRDNDRQVLREHGFIHEVRVKKDGSKNRAAAQNPGVLVVVSGYKKAATPDELEERKKEAR